MDTEVAMPRTFTIGGRDFLRDGRPFQIISGALHYFRVHPDHWADRIAKARQMGLNTIETYIPWNEHQPEPGTVDFSGRLDLSRFLRLVHDAGMSAIVRPGPFICAEWDNGGLPAWLFSTPGVGIRRHEPAYLAAVESFFQHALSLVAPLQVTRGGPVIMVQVENEYGAYGDDPDYLQALVSLIKSCDIDVPLFTCDQATPEMLARGGLTEVLRTATFGSRSADRLAVLRAAQPSGPLMCAEFWNGWFDHWGAHHHTTSAADAARELDTLLAAGASVNLYMFHGGTNFGFTNGANHKGIHQPTVTSYDYDAPLSEDGYPTPKYHALREVIARYASVPDDLPASRPPAPTPTARINRAVSLLQLPTAEEPLRSEQPVSMDSIGQYRGFALYRTTITTPAPSALTLGEVRDRAIVLLDGQPLATLSRENRDTVALLPAADAAELAILVEDQGRVNYGPKIGEQKGLLGPVEIDGTPVTGWTVQPLPLDAPTIRAALTPVDRSRLAGSVAAAGEFVLDRPADLYLDTDGWTKGVAFVNGFNLGRYWSRGAQRTLYVPGPVTRAGTNEVIMVELHGSTTAEVRFAAGPDLGPDEP